MLEVRPLFGLGLGTFYHYYQVARTEFYTAGWHSHNDMLQIAIEMGFPALAVFMTVFGTALVRTNRANLLPGCILLGILLQSMTEFQFYIPAVSVLAGMALANHIQLRRQHEEPIPIPDVAALAAVRGLGRG